jgi:hypothetical protein
VVTLSALDTRMGLAREGACPMRRAMEDHVLAEARLVERFQRGRAAGVGRVRARRVG